MVYMWPASVLGEDNDTTKRYYTLFWDPTAILTVTPLGRVYDIHFVRGIEDHSTVDIKQTAYTYCRADVKFSPYYQYTKDNIHPDPDPNREEFYFYVKREPEIYRLPRKMYKDNFYFDEYYIDKFYNDTKKVSVDRKKGYSFGPVSTHYLKGEPVHVNFGNRKGVLTADSVMMRYLYTSEFKSNQFQS